MKRQAIESLQAAIYTAIKTINPSRAVYTTFPPLDTPPPFTIFTELSAEPGKGETRDRESHRIGVLVESWDRSGENTTAIEMVDEVITAMLSGLDLTANEFTVTDAEVVSYGVKTEAGDSLEHFQHGIVRAFFEITDTSI